MSDRLYNTLQLPSLAAGATSAPVAHGLRAHGLALVPDLVSCPGCAVASVDDTDISVTNTGDGAFAPQVMVQHLHSITRALGITGQSDPSIQPFVLSGGAPPFGMVGATGLRMTSEPGLTEAYVDGVNGLDTNDGLTEGTALQTIQRIYEIFPWWYMGQAQLLIHLAGVGGFGANAAAPLDYTQDSVWVGGGGDLPNYTYRGPHMVPFVPTTGSSAPVLDATPTILVGQTDVPDVGAQRTRVTCTAPGWTAHDFRDRVAYARFTRGGNLVIFECPIADNETDRLWLDLPIADGVILSTDTLEIVQQGAWIKGDLTYGPYTTPCVFGRGAAFSGDYVNYPDMVDHFNTFERIGFRGFHTTDVRGLTLDRCASSGNVATNVGAYIIGASTNFQGFKNIGVFAFHTSTIQYFIQARRDNANSPPLANRTLTVEVMNAKGAIFLGEHGSHGGRWTPYRNISCYAAGNSGIVLQGNTNSLCARKTSLQGDSNTRGIELGDGGRCRCKGGKYVTITGGGVDIQLEGVAIPYGTGPGAFEESFPGYAGRGVTPPPGGNFSIIWLG